MFYCILFPKKTKYSLELKIDKCLFLYLFYLLKVTEIDIDSLILKKI